MTVRALSHLLLAVYLTVLAAPCAITAGFIFDRDRIAKEFCVQRTLPEGQRTCHGQCHLMKQLLAERNDARTPVPPPVLPEKIQPEWVDQPVRWALVIPTRSLVTAILVMETRFGFPSGPDPVPWC